MWEPILIRKCSECTRYCQDDALPLFCGVSDKALESFSCDTPTKAAVCSDDQRELRDPVNHVAPIRVLRPVLEEAINLRSQGRRRQDQTIRRLEKVPEPQLRWGPRWTKRCVVDAEVRDTEASNSASYSLPDELVIGVKSHIIVPVSR